MRYIKGILIFLLGIFLTFIAIQVHAYMFDTLLQSRSEYIKSICQEVIDDNPIIYYPDGSGLPASPRRGD